MRHPLSQCGFQNGAGWGTCLSPHFCHWQYGPSLDNLYVLLLLTDDREIRIVWDRKSYFILLFQEAVFYWEGLFLSCGGKDQNLIVGGDTGF